MSEKRNKKKYDTNNTVQVKSENDLSCRQQHSTDSHNRHIYRSTQHTEKLMWNRMRVRVCVQHSP